MTLESYVQYLETVVISLLKERMSEGDIVVEDEDAVDSLRGSTISTINLREEIESQRFVRRAKEQITEKDLATLVKEAERMTTCKIVHPLLESRVREGKRHKK